MSDRNGVEALLDLIASLSQAELDAAMAQINETDRNRLFLAMDEG